MPAVGDDIDMSSMDWPTAKAFGDPSESDALLWARWGGSSFAQGQWRCYTTNPYNERIESNVHVHNLGGSTYISYPVFLEILDANFPKKNPKEEPSPKDAEALCQRLHIVLITKTCLYYKRPRCTGPVLRIDWPNGLDGRPRHDLFTEVGEQIMKDHAQDPSYKPTNLIEHRAWDMALMHLLQNKQRPPRGGIVHEQSNPLMESPQSRYFYPDLNNPLPLDDLETDLETFLLDTPMPDDSLHRTVATVINPSSLSTFLRPSDAAQASTSITHAVAPVPSDDDRDLLSPTQMWGTNAEPSRSVVSPTQPFHQADEPHLQPPNLVIPATQPFNNEAEVSAHASPSLLHAKPACSNDEEDVAEFNRILVANQEQIEKQMTMLDGATFDVECPLSPRAIPKTPPTPKPCQGVEPSDVDNAFIKEKTAEYKRDEKAAWALSASMHGACFDITTPPASPEKKSSRHS